MSTVIFQIRSVPRLDVPQTQFYSAEPKFCQRLGRELRTESADPLVGEHKNALVEKGIEVDGEQKPVVNIKSLAVRTVLPWLGVTRP